MRKLVVAILALCLVKVDAIPIPAHAGVYPYSLKYDAKRDVFLDEWARFETWCRQSRCVVSPDEIPAKKKISWSLRADLFREEHWKYAAAGSMLMGQVAPVRRRFVGINVESILTWPEESKVWPHLGIVYVGTCADLEGYEVKLWDEFIQGPAPLEKLVQEGDVVGLSLVTTGIERGVDLARKCKELGARYVIAGNDSAMFRAPQLLRIAGKPIDAVFTSNSIVSIRLFFQRIQTADIGRINVKHVAVEAANAPFVSNEAVVLAAKTERLEIVDYFMVPNLALFESEYWNAVWMAYRSQFGHKHLNPNSVRNAVALLAQGCGRAGAGEFCKYCTIEGAETVLVPGEEYLKKTLETYRAFGINTIFNVADSSFEMGTLVERLAKLEPIDTLVLYGRAQAIAQPGRLQQWLSVVKDRLLINCGMDSGDEAILQGGIAKAASKVGSRLAENYVALRAIRAAGKKAHLHYSVIFGSPGETSDSCKRTLDFIGDSIAMLGGQLDIIESDIWWVNFGAPCAAIFRDYDYADKLAQSVGNVISREQWEREFATYADQVVVPWSCEEAWYHYFTHITLDAAREHIDKVRQAMGSVPGAIPGRDFNFKPPPA